ncbi:exonuclease domain-containing protein [Cohaesibacter sp. CAU 1516]|uniref:exonuclease domain-containing protein n=1 Tax=Cohaesibacter sp. CAU 1516 TaxID=2576038 RepID=UPI001FEF022C|nr:exonuclease domain-containing protein [Cohaesibacter sp. CAU 1516]
MTIPTATEILSLLKQAKPRRTAEAPRDARGIYGLYDHTGTFRYIGSTSSAAETFYKRIHQRHRTGSESSSHYFSRMYNTGRMWRKRNDPATKSDGDIAKALRNKFIARHCGCTWVTLPDHADIAGLEAQVITLAPPEMVAWNRGGMEAYDEPIDLVDALIAELGLSPTEHAALGRQRDRHLGGMFVVQSATSSAEVSCGLPPLPKGPFRFFALDVETANHDRGSICQVGVACVRPDSSIVTWVTLVDPRTSRWVFSGLHGITKSMVTGAPTIGAVIDALDAMLNGYTVYQHSGFDQSAIRAACENLAREEPSWAWNDSVSVARVAWPELKGNGGHGLASLKAHLGLQFEHHDAGEDARAAAEIVVMAERSMRVSVKPRSEPTNNDVLDYDDIGLASMPDTAIPRNVFAAATPIGTRLTADMNAIKALIRVPVAADGSCFGPDLARNGHFTVGAKGEEKKYDSFEAALDALTKMDKPRWRRPNSAGNWGIVSGNAWKSIERG